MNWILNITSSTPVDRDPVFVTKKQFNIELVLNIDLISFQLMKIPQLYNERTTFYILTYRRSCTTVGSQTG